MTPRRVLGGLAAAVILAAAFAYGLSNNRLWIIAGLLAALVLILVTETDTS